MKDINQKTDREGLKEANLAGVCQRACRKARAEIARARAAVLAEWSEGLKAQRHALRLALNEAEALAWQTMYPHLVFPILAAEKVQAVAAWNRRQQRLWWNTPSENRSKANDLSIGEQKVTL